MDARVKEVVHELTRASDEERIAFPDVVRTLIQNGVERYHADLASGMRTYYMPDGSHEVTAGYALATPTATSFSADIVVAALRAIQRKEITYRTFCGRIAAGGCAGYFVSATGKRALYYGRANDTYVEWFPSARP